MDIYSYAGFAYGLTAVISLGTVGLILMINSVMNWVVHKAKNEEETQAEETELADAQ